MLKSYSWKVVELEGGAIGRYLGHNGWTLMNGKEATEKFLTPSAMWAHSEKAPAMNQEDGPCSTMLAPLILATKIVRNKFLIFISYPVCGIFVIAAWPR